MPPYCTVALVQSWVFCVSRSVCLNRSSPGEMAQGPDRKLWLWSLGPYDTLNTARCGHLASQGLLSVAPESGLWTPEDSLEDSHQNMSICGLRKPFKTASSTLATHENSGCGCPSGTFSSLSFWHCGVRTQLHRGGWGQFPINFLSCKK